MKSLTFVFCKHCAHSVNLHQLEEFAVIGDQTAERWHCSGAIKRGMRSLEPCKCIRLEVRDDKPAER